MNAGRSLGVLGFSLLWACGGGAAAGGGPESGDGKHAKDPAVEGTSAPSDEPAPKGTKESEPSTKDNAGTSEAADAPLDDKDIEAAMQSLLSDAELIDHLHLKQAGRAPLKVSGAKVPAKLKVIAASQEVKVVPEPMSKKAAVMVFTKIEREGGQIKLHYRFDVEGLEGRATLTLKEGHWELTANRVMEK